jgi:nucleoside-diphosphate-sugar epimerase
MRRIQEGPVRKILLCGYGYSAGFLARALQAQGWRIAATAREAAKRDALTAQGVQAHAWHEGMALPHAALDGTSHLLVSAPPGEAGDPVLAALGQAKAAPSLAWAGYLSTTGVYGDHGGAWVAEDSALNARSPRSLRRVAAERAWTGWGEATGTPVQIYRLAGIYGPGRSALDAARDGTARRIRKAGQVFSRIHAQDIADALQRGIARPAGGLFNLCDDEPAAPADVAAYAAQLLGLPPPPWEEFETAKATMSEMALSFWADNKRVSNARAKRELGWTPGYPSYREGLKSLLERGA